jgi:hypothetical protein
LLRMWFGAAASSRVVSQLLWPDKDREVPLGENHEKPHRFPDFL